MKAVDESTKDDEALDDKIESDVPSHEVAMEKECDHTQEVSVADDLSEEEQEIWNDASKKYQDFQQTCGDLLDPGK